MLTHALSTPCAALPLWGDLSHVLTFSLEAFPFLFGPRRNSLLTAEETETLAGNRGQCWSDQGPSFLGGHQAQLSSHLPTAEGEPPLPVLPWGLESCLERMVSCLSRSASAGLGLSTQENYKAITRWEDTKHIINCCIFVVIKSEVAHGHTSPTGRFP